MLCGERGRIVPVWFTIVYKTGQRHRWTCRVSVIALVKISFESWVTTVRCDPFSAELVQIIPDMKKWALALARRADVADDVVQEALARALRYRDYFVPGSNLKAWVRVIVRNEFFGRQRAVRREVYLEDVTDTRTVGPDQEERLRLDEARRALLSMSLEKREALLVVGLGGLDYDEAAQLLDCPLGTLKSRVSRARKELQNTLESGSFPKVDSQPRLAAAVLTRAAERVASRPRRARPAAARMAA